MNRFTNEETVHAYIALGSNLGKREELLSTAIRLLHEQDGIAVTKQSRVYETDPVGFVDQPAFLNMAVEVKTSLPADELLRRCLDIEQSLGRVRELRWGPRVIDLDVLLYAEETWSTPQLLLPHPRMKERLFVLFPLLDILQTTSSYYASLLEAFETLDGKAGVRLWEISESSDGFEHSEN